MKKLFPILGIVALAIGATIFLAPSALAATTFNTTDVSVNQGASVVFPEITITDDSADAAIEAATDIYIEIPVDATTTANWDTRITTPDFTGTAVDTGKVSPTVTYPDVKHVKIDVTTNFDEEDTLIINGLFIVGHTGAKAPAGIKWSIDGGSTYDGVTSGGNITVSTAGPEETLTGVTVTSTNSVIQEEDVTYVVNFTLPTGSYIPPDGLFVFTFPVGTDLSEVTPASFSATLSSFGAVTVNDAANVLTVTRGGAGPYYLGNGSNVSLTIADVINTNVVGPANTIAVAIQTTGVKALSSGTSAAFATLAVPATIAMTCESSGQAGAIWLRWTEPDGALGGEYTVKRSAAAILEAQWNDATVVTQTWVPLAKGVAHQELVTGLNPNSTYYFAIKTMSNGDKESIISNSPSCIAPTSAKANIDSTAPTSYIVSPASNSTVQTGIVVLRGTARDTGGSSIQKVEVSLDGGLTWNPAVVTQDAETNIIWEFTIANASAGSLTARVRSTDWTNNVEINGPTVTFNVSATGTPANGTTPGTTTPPASGTMEQLQAQLQNLRVQLLNLLIQLVSQLQAQLNALR